MNGRINSPRAVSAALALVAAMMILGSTVASAIGWNPPCGNVTVRNMTGCVIGLCPAWAPMLAPPCTPFIAPGGVVVIPTPGPALNLNGMISWGGFVYPILPPPAFPPVPCTGWVPNFMTGPAPGCCVDVFIDVPTCTFWVYPSGAGVPCRP